MSVRVRDGISPRLDHIARHLADARPMLEAMGAALSGWVVASFGDPGKRIESWPPLSTGERSTLERSGALRQSLGRAPRVTSSSVTVGTDRAYAAIHQFGGVIRPKSAGALAFQIGGETVLARRARIPRRPFFPVSAGGGWMPAAVGHIEDAGAEMGRAVLRGARPR